jgi:hypothetical protein
MNYATQVGKPTAHITKKKSRLKVYNGNTVFLDDKDNFEFEIHNPKQNSVLVKIKLNGEYISTSGIVLRPGQRVFLERFLDSNNKFEFSTYEVNNTSENRSAIDLNGDVKIEFYDEQTIINYPHLSGGNWGNGWTTINTGTNNPQHLYYGTTISTTGGIGTTSSSTAYYSSDSTFTSSVDMSTLSSKKSIETGRVEKGKESKQNFTNSFENFNSNTSHKINFKILPLNVKNKTTEDIRQYCTECGTKTKTNFKFCPSCGNKL